MNGTGRVILLNWTVHQYNKPLTVAELMLDYPQEVVVEFQSSVMNRKRPCPLPVDKKLETHKVYIMLPMKRGKQIIYYSLVLKNYSLLKVAAGLLLMTMRPVFLVSWEA